MTQNEAILLIAAELNRARDKFPGFHSSHEGYAVIHEELDELWDAIKANDHTHASYEAVQVAAMALRFLTDLCVFEDVKAYNAGRTGVVAR